jgi:hypothetical protein
MYLRISAFAATLLLATNAWSEVPVNEASPTEPGAAQESAAPGGDAPVTEAAAPPDATAGAPSSPAPGLGTSPAPAAGPAASAPGGQAPASGSVDLGTARATEASTAEPAAAPVEEVPTSVHRHDGFYLRLGAGFGGVRDQMLYQPDGGSSNDFENVGYVSGIATTGEFAIGGTVARGLVLGGGVYTAGFMVTDFVRDPESSFTDALPTEVDSSHASLTVIGPFIDYYFQEDGGFHLQGALGVAVLSGLRNAQGVDNSSEGAAGGGLVFGLGNEWWVADDWSMGVLGRLTVAALFQEDDQQQTWVHAAATVPSVLFTVTYH